MKAIIFLASRSRYHIPRVGGFVHAPQFAAATHPNQPIVLEGRALTMDEFNTAAAKWLDRRSPNLGYDVSVRLVEDDEVPSVTPLAPVERPAEQPAPQEPGKFRLVENDIYMGDERVGGIYENGLRCSKGYADLRDEIEAWLQSEPE